MIMITGGAYQGKTEYAKQRFGFSDDEILSGGSCKLDAVFAAKCVTEYHLLIKRLLERNTDVTEFSRRLCRENSGAVIIINEIGGGIIPIEKSERIWREETGRAGCIIAENSREVIRLVCGIPVKIKG